MTTFFIWSIGLLSGVLTGMAFQFWSVREFRHRARMAENEAEKARRDADYLGAYYLMAKAAGVPDTSFHLSQDTIRAGIARAGRLRLNRTRLTALNQTELLAILGLLIKFDSGKAKLVAMSQVSWELVYASDYILEQVKEA